MKLKVTETEIFIDNMTKKDYDKLNRVASIIGNTLGVTRTTEKEKIQGFVVYSSSYESKNHRGYCFQVGHPYGAGRNIHAHDEFYEPIKAELEKWMS